MTFQVKILQRFLAQKAGLAFSPDQFYLAESRLTPVAQAHGLRDIKSLLVQLELGHNRQLASDAIEAMTTHETLFFRDKSLFDQLHQVMMPKLRELRDHCRSLRIWCAGCSCGQEAYSIAMLIDEDAKTFAGWNIDIIATDLSQSILERAKTGLYSQFEVQRSLPINYLLRYFTRRDNFWQAAEFLRACIDFRVHNLMDNFSELGTFDIIFCRNVLIYFDQECRRDVLSRLSQALAPGGYLALGASENIGNAVANLQASREHPAIGCHVDHVTPMTRGRRALPAPHH